MRLLRSYLFLLIISFCFLPTNIKANVNDQHIKVVLRNIGHKFLLLSGDSTSRILPIEKEKEKYVVQFENEFSFQPDDLYTVVQEAFKNNHIQGHLIVEVVECQTKKVAHSFEVTGKGNELLLNCKQRALPKNCYSINFTVVNGGVVIPKEKSTSLRLLFTCIFLILILLVVFILIRRRNDEPINEIIEVGEYKFNVKNMILSHKEESFELSNIETKLLELLLQNEDKTLDREEILNLVWGDEGNYVGRTLDVFISKLRKKLQKDASIKIINVRGVGYRFVITSS